jgi:hypothetical protein
MREAALAGTSVVVIAIVVGFTVLGRSGTAAAHPTLRVIHSSPLTVRGVHFRSSERVDLTAGRRTVRARASGAGTFVVTIRGVTRCDVTRVLARGSAGSYVVVKMLASPECLPARSK